MLVEEEFLGSCPRKEQVLQPRVGNRWVGQNVSGASYDCSRFRRARETAGCCPVAALGTANGRRSVVGGGGCSALRSCSMWSVIVLGLEPPSITPSPVATNLTLLFPADRTTAGTDFRAHQEERKRIGDLKSTTGNSRRRAVPIVEAGSETDAEARTTAT